MEWRRHTKRRLCLITNMRSEIVLIPSPSPVHASTCLNTSLPLREGGQADTPILAQSAHNPPLVEHQPTLNIDYDEGA